ncbi:MarR family winged helix-turn-helix transcriptional regulator [Nocardioides caldifontis]|uniref:MarR family winged helix-turn-helix transcriptional regulator n=1 Tax=Nocardioides caldifontis TaxID=2588938 RepID=UPI0011DF09AA|nr:MarR family transcriptional regulator [Nocardioides caldifontis]
MRDHVDTVLAQWEQERPDLDVAAMGVIGRLSRASRLLERGVDRVLDQRGVGGGEFDILATLRRTGAPYRLTPGQLVRSSMVTSGAVTARLDRLVAKGLVTRETDPDNRRSVLVTLTPRGRRLVDRAVEAHVANEEELLSGLSGREREQLAGLLRRLLVSLGDAAEEP